MEKIIYFELRELNIRICDSYFGLNGLYKMLQAIFS